MAKTNITPNIDFDTRLAAAEAHYQEQRKVLALPRMTDRQEVRLQTTVTFSAYRMVRYLFNGHQGARTDTIAAAVAIGNVPDVVMKNQGRLAVLGLNIRCEEVPSINRYGSRTVIGRWWVSIVDPEKWYGPAANDSEA